GNEFGRVRADDVGADNFLVLFAQQHLHKTFGIARRDGLATRLVGKLADFVLEAFFLGSLFSEADAGDLRDAIGAAGEDGDLVRLLAGDEKPLDGLDGLMRSDV